MKHLCWIVVVVACTEPVESPVDSGDSSDPVLSAYERDLAPLLLACTGCHSGEDAEAGLDLTDVRAQAEVESSQMEMALIQPYSHLDSYLWHKVAGTHGVAGGLGTGMPVGDNWSQENIDRLALWIDLGLPD